MHEHNRFPPDAYFRVPPRRPRKPYRPFAHAVLILAATTLSVAVVLGGVCAWWIWHVPQTTAVVKPRAVTARGELAADEQSTIELFRAVAPSVVHVTNLAAQRDGFSRDVYTVPRGSGTTR